MSGLGGAEILRIWELGMHRPNWHRGLLLLAPCLPDLPFSALAAVPLSERNRCLLQMREGLFGQRLDAFVECPFCGEPLEFSATTRELLESSNDPSLPKGEFERNGFVVRYRLLNSLDLAAAAQHHDTVGAETLLVRHALVEVLEQGKPLGFAELSADVMEALGAELALRDPLADPRVSLACAMGSDHVWQASLDLVAFLWTELERKAKRLLNDVQILAEAYGWHEAEILAMNEGRREYYLGALEA